ncbi:MAG: hypothetical protein NTY22_01940, partial [Proteobacteria bacterium]|nr:hypothetical protein [Pseudomonadota bacterium]
MFCFVPFLIILQSLCINIYAQSDEDLDKLLEEDTTVPQAQLQDPSFQNNTPVGESDFLKSGETLYTPPVIL